MPFKSFDRVATQSGRTGVVRSVSGRVVTVIFPEGEEFVDVDDLQSVPDTPAESLVAGTVGDAESFGLRLQALYLQHAYRYDARSGLSNARVEPKLHQVFVAHRVANKLQPRMLLADEVGLGKTIEAGLILKELRARGLVERVLVICPASLQHQWRNELSSKFNENFEIMNASAAKYLSQDKSNPFLKRDNVITSINFAQNEKRQDHIIEAPWDLVIFDEAHRVRRSMQSANKVNVTQAYRLADELKELTPGVLLLTATPMQLHPFELFSLIELVEPGMFQSFEDYDRRRRQLPRLNDAMRQLKQWSVLSLDERCAVLEEHAQLLGLDHETDPSSLDDSAISDLMDGLVKRHPLVEVMVRNRKAEIGGFAQREAHRILVDLRPDEQQLYEDISEYLRYNYNLAVSAKQNAVGFLMVTYQKMLASSPHAVLQSFRRRVAKLEKQSQVGSAPAKRPKRGGRLDDDLLDELESPEDLGSDSEGAALERELTKIEIGQLNSLIERLENLEDDSKASELIEALAVIWEEHPDEKVVIFTTFRDTQEYLQRLIERHATSNGRPVKVARFNGTLNPEEKEEAIRKFRHDCSVLICTESGGEGRNLQFAHILVNYDLPWNPMKVEQRIGRLDRIGQKHNVFIYNMACAGTVEERVLSVLEHRINLFNESVGSLDPILGDLEEDLQSLVMRHSDRFAEEFNALEQDLERRAGEAREKERVLADFILDRASLRNDEANELLGQDPLATTADLERFCTDLLEHSGGTVMSHAEGGQVITLSPRLANRLRTSAHQVRGVFDPNEALAHEDLDFFAFGNETIDRLVEFPVKVDPVSATVRKIRGLDGGPFLEMYYEVRSESSPPLGRVIRHRVDQTGFVRSDEVRSVPQRGEYADAEVPTWVAQAVVASRQQFEREQTELRAEARRQQEGRAAEQVDRATRIFSYRRLRLERMISDQERWLADNRSSANPRMQRIIPAREGRLKKDRERLEALAATFEQEVQEIKAWTPVISGSLWAASVVVAQ